MKRFFKCITWSAFCSLLFLRIDKNMWNPMSPMTKHVPEAKIHEGDQVERIWYVYAHVVQTSHICSTESDRCDHSSPSPGQVSVKTENKAASACTCLERYHAAAIECPWWMVRNSGDLVFRTKSMFISWRIQWSCCIDFVDKPPGNEVKFLSLTI